MCLRESETTAPFVHRGLAAIQVRDESLESALVLEHFRLLVALIHQLDATPELRNDSSRKRLASVS